jgi:hypothetical protein
MNRILNLQAILPSIDLGGDLVADSNTSLSCTGGNCNSATSEGCQVQNTVADNAGFF